MTDPKYPKLINFDEETKTIIDSCAENDFGGNFHAALLYIVKDWYSQGGLLEPADHDPSPTPQQEAE